MGSMLNIVWFDLSYTGSRIKKILKKGKNTLEENEQISKSKGESPRYRASKIA
jgi:hypothetical protein